MDVDFTDEQRQLAESAREFLERECPMSLVRQTLDDPTDIALGLWRQMANLGWTGLSLPERCGGSGLGVIELSLLCEAMGRTLSPAPYLSSVVLAGGALAACSTAHDARLTEIADGTARASLSLYQQGNRWGTEEPGVAASDANGGLMLDGTCEFVPDAELADFLLIPAQAGESPRLCLVDTQAPGFERHPIAWPDSTRRMSAVHLRGVELAPDDALPIDGLDGLLDAARVAIAAEMLGGAERVLELSVEFAKTREQFGRPIGAFQSIQHRCADMLVLVESARSAVTYAAWAVDAKTPDAHRAACMAKAYCSDAYVRIAGDGIQIHGGLGFTWEQDLHLYFKRAKADEAILGDAAWHREEVARELLDG